MHALICIVQNPAWKEILLLAQISFPGALHRNATVAANSYEEAHQHVL